MSSGVSICIQGNVPHEFDGKTTIVTLSEQQALDLLYFLYNRLVQVLEREVNAE